MSSVICPCNELIMSISVDICFITGESCETVAADCPEGNSSSVLQSNYPDLFGCVET